MQPRKPLLYPSSCRNQPKKISLQGIAPERFTQQGKPLAGHSFQLCESIWSCFGSIVTCQRRNTLLTLAIAHHLPQLSPFRNTKMTPTKSRGSPSKYSPGVRAWQRHRPATGLPALRRFLALGVLSSCGHLGAREEPKGHPQGHPKGHRGGRTKDLKANYKKYMCDKQSLKLEEWTTIEPRPNRIERTVHRSRVRQFTSKGHLLIAHHGNCKSSAKNSNC